MGWIGCIHSEKFRCNFVARTFALIAQVRPVLHRASCSNEIIQNAPKHYETHQYMSLGSNGVDDATSSHELLHQLHQFNPFCTEFHVVMKHCQMHPNTTRRTKTLVYGPMGWIGSVHWKNFRLRGTNFCTKCTSSTQFATSFVR